MHAKAVIPFVAGLLVVAACSETSSDVVAADRQVPTAQATKSSSSGRALDVGLTRLSVTQDFLDGPDLARAFVETGSDSQHCLATFAENDPGFGADGLRGLVTMCRPRVIDGNKGVGVLIVLPESFVGLESFQLDLTVYHAGAFRYAAPVPCGEC